LSRPFFPGFFGRLRGFFRAFWLSPLFIGPFFYFSLPGGAFFIQRFFFLGGAELLPPLAPGRGGGHFLLFWFSSCVAWVWHALRFVGPLRVNCPLPFSQDFLFAFFCLLFEHLIPFFSFSPLFSPPDKFLFIVCPRETFLPGAH